MRDTTFPAMGIAFLLCTALIACSENRTSVPADIGPFTYRITAFTWMPGGKAIICNAMRIDTTEERSPTVKKVMVDLATHALSVLPVDGSNVAVSPDGSQAAYVSFSDGDIHSVDLRTHNDEVLLADSVPISGLNWSPDGNRIAYSARYHGADGNTYARIFVLDRRSRITRPITRNERWYSYWPAWSPDGSTIAYFLEKGDGHDQIHLTDSLGSQDIDLTNDTTTHNHSPSWIDANEVLFIRGEGMVHMHVKGGEAQAYPQIQATIARVDPVSGLIAYLDEAERLMLFDPDNGASRVVLEGRDLKKILDEAK